jgi:hypothetical protein
MGFITNITSLEEVPRFNVIKEEVFDSHGARVNGLYTLMREDTRDHLGVCRDKYRPIQLDEMLDIVNTATAKVGGIDHIGYTFSRNGKRIVLQSKLSEQFEINGDKIDGMFYTVIDNSGMNSNKIIASTRRIICDNSLHIVTKEAAQSRGKGNLRHSFTFDENVITLSNKISNNINLVKTFNKTIEMLQGKKFTEDQMRQLAQRLLPSRNNIEDTTKLISKRENIVLRFSRGIGNEGKTMWDALNAVTEYESHRKFTPEKLVRTLSTETLSNKALELLVA